MKRAVTRMLVAMAATKAKRMADEKRLDSISLIPAAIRRMTRDITTMSLEL